MNTWDSRGVFKQYSHRCHNQIAASSSKCFRLGYLVARRRVFPGQTSNPFHVKNWLTFYLDFIEVTVMTSLTAPNHCSPSCSSGFGFCLMLWTTSSHRVGGDTPEFLENKTRCLHHFFSTFWRGVAKNRVLETKPQQGA